MPSIEEKISNLDGFVNAKAFFEENDLRSLTREQLRQLLVKMVTLDSHYHVSAFVNMVQSELGSRDANKKFRISTAKAIVATVISVLAQKSNLLQRLLRD